jgi:hypothetical protein
VLEAATGTIKIRIEIDNPNHKLRPGMFATVRINTAHSDPSGIVDAESSLDMRRETQAPTGRAGIAGLQLDLVNLATSYSDAVAGVELAQAKLQRLDVMKDRNVVPEREALDARISMTAAKRKVEILRAIAEVARDATKQELEVVKQAYLSGTVSPNKLPALEGNLRIIELILRSSHNVTAPGEGTGDAGPPDRK